MKWKTIIIVIFAISGMMRAQQHSEWFLTNHPYRTAFNPAERPPFRSFVAIPILGNLNGAALSSSITLSDVEDDGEYTINNNTIEVMANKAKPKNLLMVETSIPTLGLGFTVGKNYFNITGRTRLESMGDFNKDLFALRYGQRDYWNQPAGQTYNIKTGIQLDGFHELAVGINRPISEKLVVGARLKYIKGFASIQANDLNMTVTRTTNAIQITPNTTMRTAIPTTITEDEEGNIEDIEFDDISFSNLLGSSNSGWGIDLGATYQMNDKLKLGASITDVGRIVWKDDVTRYALNTSFSFGEGSDGSGVDTDDYWEELRSTFYEKLKYQENAPKYATSLNTKINLTAEYRINKMISAGLLGSLHHFADEWRPKVSLGGNIHPASWVEASLYYTAAYKTMDNLGLGVNFNFGPVNLFLASDNILAAFNYKNANYLTTRFGINLIFWKQPVCHLETTPTK